MNKRYPVSPCRIAVSPAVLVPATLALACGGSLFSGVANADDAQLLPGIVVEATPGVATEDSNSYTTYHATVGSKQPVDLRDVPQTVNVITQQRLDDGGAHSLEEAAYLLPNITTTTGDGFSGSLYSRGHEVFTYNVDGAPRPYLSIYGTAPDMVFFDRVEVLSGPSGLFQGSGEPVGTINLVRKRAQAEFGLQGAVSYGSFDAKRGELDITGSFTDDGSVRGRAIVYALDEDSFVDVTGRERSGGSGTVEFDIGESTTLSIGGIIEEQDVLRHSGLPTYADGTLINFDRDTFLGAPWSQADYETGEGFIELEHTFSNGGVAKVMARQYDRDAHLKSALPSSAVDRVTGNFSMLGFAREFDESTQYLDANYTAPFSFFGNRSEFSVGADMRKTDQDMQQKFAILGAYNINNFDPDSIAEPVIDFDTPGPGWLDTTTETEEFGVYAVTRLGLTNRLKATIGARYADYDSDTVNNNTLVETSIDETEVIPFAGLSYDMSESATAYVSFSEIFQPQSEQEADGSQLEPVIGQQVELGVKAEFNGLNAQAAVYWLEDENRAEDDPNNPGAFLASGEADTTGFEASIGGEVMPGLDIVAGYAYVDTELESDPTSDHNVSLWAKYRFSGGDLNGLYIGGGVRYASSFDIESGGTRIEAPSYTVVDALVGYKVSRNVDVQLLVNNLFDEDYVERINQTSRGTFYGEPLNATLRLNATF
ncbi:TonB-dependent siderophore receptor [Thiosocius teredinicola]|uniref:TonB-dependent siderophore receptor n=1 Tax=Thiosocius teredinicola TaxID=1973002 RepID=UPI00099107F9